MRDGEIADAVLHGHHVDGNGRFECVDFVAQPGFDVIAGARAADGDGEVIARDAAHPEIRELVAIDIELRIGRAGESGIAYIGGNANDGVGSRVAQGDALAHGIFAGQELAGKRFAQDHGVATIEAPALE